MKVVEVSPISSKVAKDSLTYFSSKSVRVGDIVSVEVRKKVYDALVVSVREAKDLKGDLKRSSFGFKKVLSVKGASPFYTEFFESCQQTREYFVGNLGQIMDYFLPTDFLLRYAELPKQKKRKLGNSVLHVVPTILEAEHLYKLLRSDLNNVFIIHGGLRKKALLERYADILAHDGPVIVIMTPSFLFIPRHDIGSIVIEHDSSSHWRTIKRPYFDLRVFAKYLAKNLGATLTYGKGLLSVETVAGLKDDKDIDFDMKGKAPQIVDMSEKENLYKKSFILSNAAFEVLKKGGHTFLFALRKGLATQVICHDCRHVLKDGDAPLTLHVDGDKNIFKNAYTKKTLDTKVRCPDCGSWNFDSLGIGTDTVNAEVKKFFPKRKIFQIDNDVTSSDKKAREVVAEFYKHENAVLIGTEMAIPYLAGKIDHSIIISMDSLLHIPSYKVLERMLHLSLAIKDHTRGDFIVQTREPDNIVAKSLKEKDLRTFFLHDLEKRKTFGYPPFSAVVKLSRLSGKNDPADMKILMDENLGKWKPNIRRFNRGKFVETSVLIKVPKESWNENRQDKELGAFLSSLGPDWQIRINPENLF